MELKYYKREQGPIVRAVTIIAVAVLTLFGCYCLYNYIPLIDVTIGPPHPPTFWGRPLATIPFFDFEITTGMIFSSVLFVVIMFFIYLWILNKPKTADFLIDTEIELKKVSWPPRQQHIGSSVAVIISVIILGIFLLIVDSVLKQIMRLIRLQ